MGYGECPLRWSCSFYPGTELAKQRFLHDLVSHVGCPLGKEGTNQTIHLALLFLSICFKTDSLVYKANSWESSVWLGLFILQKPRISETKRVSQKTVSLASKEGTSGPRTGWGLQDLRPRASCSVLIIVRGGFLWGQMFRVHKQEEREMILLVPAEKP